MIDIDVFKLLFNNTKVTITADTCITHVFFVEDGDDWFLNWSIKFISRKRKWFIFSENHEDCMIFSVKWDEVIGDEEIKKIIWERYGFGKV